ncbi:hypothetical protein BH10BAC3_BH10BAC3_37590 [soil metagenome]
MKILFFISLLVVNSLYSNGQSVAINNDGSLPNTSSMLDIKSSAKGLLIPRMSSQQRVNIQTPVKGLMVFDNYTNSFWFYNGAGWVQVAGGGGAGYWALNGNDIYKTNTGNVGVGIANPLAPIHIKNDNEALRIEGTTPYISFHDNAGVRTGFLQSYNYNLILGCVVVDKSINNKITATINAVKTGEFLLTVTDKTGVSDLIRITEKMEAGTAKNELLATENFTKGNYYVQLYFQGKLVHVQEINM